MFTDALFFYLLTFMRIMACKMLCVFTSWICQLLFIFLYYPNGGSLGQLFRGIGLNHY